jgi:hypothetical protein
MKELLKQLRESPEFQTIMLEVLRLRPIVSEYAPQATVDETTNLIERIKYDMARRAGYDLLYSILMGKPPQ